jgi:hypothetical protein
MITRSATYASAKPTVRSPSQTSGIRIASAAIASMATNNFTRKRRSSVSKRSA